MIYVMPASRLGVLTAETYPEIESNGLQYGFGLEIRDTQDPFLDSTLDIFLKFSPFTDDSRVP